MQNLVLIHPADKYWNEIQYFSVNGINCTVDQKKQKTKNPYAIKSNTNYDIKIKLISINLK